MTIKIMMIGASLEQNGGIATVEKLILKHANDNFEIRHITSHDEGDIKHRLMVFNQALIKLFWKLITQKVDIIYIHLSDGGSLVRKSIITLIGFIFNKPVFIHTHGAEFHVTYSRLPKLAKQFLSSLFCRCNGFIVLSTIWQDFYINNLGLNPERVFVLPNPTELPVTIPQRCNKEKVTLLFCGRVGERKGAFDLIKAFANLPAATRNSSELILAGDGDIEQGKELVKSFNLVDKIKFLGWVDSKQRDSLLNQADVFILPSYNEGLPMAILEAMAWGLPIISTPVGGIPELVITHKNGFLVTPGHIEQLSQVIQSLTENQELRLSLGKDARETVIPFDVNNYCPQLLNIFTKYS